MGTMGGQESSTIADSIKNMPGAVIAFAGFGIFLLSIEARRLPAIQVVDMARHESGYILSLISLCLIVVIAFLLKKKLDVLNIRSIFVILVGVLMSTSMFFLFGQSIFDGNSILRDISQILSVICEATLFFCWIRVLYPCGPKIMAISFGFALFVLAAVSSLTAFFKVEAAHGVLTMLPILSSACWCYYRDYARSHTLVKESAKADRDSVSESDSLLLPSDETTMGFRSSLIILGLSMFCYALVFGYIHFEWVQFQDGGYISLAMQLGIALGAACAGLFALLFVRFLWSRRNLELYRLFLVPTIILALWLSTFVNVAWIVLYLVLLNITQKLVFFFIVLAPFMIKDRTMVLWPWCIAYLTFAGGRTASSVILNTTSQETFAFLSVISLIVLFACGAVSVFRIGEAGDIQQHAQQMNGSSGIEPSYSNSHKFHKACHVLSGQYHLTQREGEILVLLARGRTAQHIAESLIISPATVKTHLRNIYAKMGVHNQQEVINLVEQVIPSQNEATYRKPH